MRWQAAAVIASLLTGCTARTTGAAALPDREFAGHLLTTETGSWFRPCRAEPAASPLWVTFTDESVRQIEAVRANGVALVGDTAFVRWRAAPTDERMVGPGGPALLVRHITDVRPAREGDCRGDATGLSSSSRAHPPAPDRVRVPVGG